ncbi:GNAT family N-acetyltransferase [Nocardiopsis metallicus]|uniref:GNAT family N-acetyltransferase n=1 Tax=Nocardiopsis metallicus TaxID=179819 RepID=UPI0031D5A073
MTRVLLQSVRSQAKLWGCRRLYLISEPDNEAAHAAWAALGFVNVAGDHQINGVSVVTDFKGPGRSRAVYELPLS